MTKNKSILTEEINKLHNIVGLISERKIGEYNKSKTFTPNDNVANTAIEALKTVDSVNLQSNTEEGSGREKAVELSEKKPQTLSQLKKMSKFFSANENMIGQIRTLGGPKNEQQKALMHSWLLHGGDPGKTWVDNELGKHHDVGKRKQKLLRTTGGFDDGSHKGTGVFDTTIMDATKLRINR
jgi:hypothetical protein